MGGQGALVGSREADGIDKWMVCGVWRLRGRGQRQGDAVALVAANERAGCCVTSCTGAGSRFIYLSQTGVRSALSIPMHQASAP